MSMEPVDTFEHAGLSVRICWEEFDQEFANPRACDGNLGVMFCDYRGYSLGDEDAPDPREQTIECPVCEGEGELSRVAVPDDHTTDATVERTCERCEGAGEVELSIVEYLQREHGARVILPLFVYEHSGITISAGANMAAGKDNFNRHGRYAMDPGAWDTSSVGVIFDTNGTREEAGWRPHELTDEKIEEMLHDEVKWYAAYLEGNVFGYEVVDENDEVLDSCWGFLELNVWSEDASVRYEARSAAEVCAEHIKAEQREAAEWAARDTITT